MLTFSYTREICKIRREELKKKYNLNEKKEAGIGFRMMNYINDMSKDLNNTFLIDQLNDNKKYVYCLCGRFLQLYRLKRHFYSKYHKDKIRDIKNKVKY